MGLAPLGSRDAKSLGWTALLVQTIAELFSPAMALFGTQWDGKNPRLGSV
jgi:hypothetical protein